MGFEDKNESRGRAVGKRLADEIGRRTEDGRITCASAVAAAELLGVAPSDAGAAVDALGVRLTVCQLGLFGYPGRAKGWTAAGTEDRPVPPGFEEALGTALAPNGTMDCAGLWALAERFGIPRLQAGFLADQKGVRIRGCQLGAF
jgi:hypothetical protein